jgi:triosephosphate isomerase
MARKPLMAGNWKMNLNHVEAVGLVQKLAWTLEDKKHDPAKSEVVVLPPFTDLRTVQTLVEGDRLELAYGAQDVSQHASGAFTGDISADMLVKLGCTYVAVGHSERREYHHETDAIVDAKTAQALNRGLTPIVCVGEGLEIRKAGEHVAYTLAQVAGSLADLTADQLTKVVIAYEPVWAIGTGKTATPEMAADAHRAIRAQVAKKYGKEAADAVRILYGGSVKPDNVKVLMAQPEIDGVLVGGAALDAVGFASIVNF